MGDYRWKTAFHRRILFWPGIFHGTWYQGWVMRILSHFTHWKRRL